MELVSRRALFRGAGTVGAATAIGAAAPLFAPGPAVAAPTEANGFIHDQGGQVFNITNPAYGAKGDGRQVTAGGSMNAGSASLMSNQGGFQPTDVGKVATVAGAGAGGGVLATKIAAYVSSVQVTLQAPAQTSVSAANFSYGTDDTLAIVAAATAAGTAGRLFAPPGNYMITGAANGGSPITLTGTGGLFGCGDGWSFLVSTMFLCADETAGIVANGCATYQGFRVDGNNMAPWPFQNTGGGNATFMNVWVTGGGSTGAAWNVSGVRDSSYWNCGTRNNLGHGLFIHDGSNGLDFWHWHQDADGGYAVYGDRLSGESSGTSDINFYSGILDSGIGGPSKIYLRHATNWKFITMAIPGLNLSGVAPIVDLDQSSGYGIEFVDCPFWIRTSPNNGELGYSAFGVDGAVPAGAPPSVFLRTDRCKFVGGDCSITINASGAYRYSAVGWYDDFTFGPRAASGLPGIDTLLEGRVGGWKTAAASAPWSGNVSYRVNADGRIQLRGSVTGGPGKICTLPLGYHPTSGPTRHLPVSLTNGSGTITVATNGDVSSTAAPGADRLYLDGVCFPTTGPPTGGGGGSSASSARARTRRPS